MTARILIVDDTPLNLKLLAAKLAHDYYIVSTAENGPEALAKVDAETPDLILLDIMMPGMDGFEVCRILKSQPQTAHIPVVMVTALSDVTDRVRGLEAGADDFLTKPINDVALMSRVRSLLRLKTIMDEWRSREKTSLQFSNRDDNESALAASLTGSHVLLLEDNTLDAEIISNTLRDLSASVELAKTVAEAASMARTGYYDVVFASLDLRSEDGLHICPQLRSQDSTRHLPILLLANENEMGQVARGLDLGANDYLLRPLDRNELIARTRTQLRHKRHYDNMRKHYEMSMAMALVDPLTGAYNRRFLETHLPRMLARSSMDRRPVSVLMIDIDHFKDVNTKYLHEGGDIALRLVAGRLLTDVRPSDLVTRMGGEEFSIIMPTTTLEAAHSIADRLRDRISKMPIELPDGQTFSVTVSIGCTCLTDESDVEMSQLLQRADRALYAAKEAGRNRVVIDDNKTHLTQSAHA